VADSDSHETLHAHGWHRKAFRCAKTIFSIGPCSKAPSRQRCPLVVPIGGLRRNVLGFGPSRPNRTTPRCYDTPIVLKTFVVNAARNFDFITKPARSMRPQNAAARLHAPKNTQRKPKRPNMSFNVEIQTGVGRMAICVLLRLDRSKGSAYAP
jgi:hypothetical protein